MAAGALSFVVLVANGCLWRKERVPEATPPVFTIKSGGTNLVVTPAASPVGRIISTHKEGNFAVIGFPVGYLPANGTVFGVYHAGVKAGQIRISGPAGDTYTVGDFIAGSGQEGDEVRAE